MLVVKRCSHFSTIPDAFADLVLSTAYEDWSLECVTFCYCNTLEFSEKMKQAVHLLKQHGVYKVESYLDPRVFHYTISD